MLSDRNIRVILFIKTCYQNLWFDKKEINELYLKKEMKYDDSFTKTSETFKKSTTTDIDMLINDDTCVRINEENEEKTIELDGEEDVNDVNIVDLID